MKAIKVTTKLAKTRMVQDFILADFVKGLINKACEIFRNAIR